MVDYKELFHDIIIESQGETCLQRTKQLNPIMNAYHAGRRHGTILGVTLGFRTMAEAGHIPMEMYDQWHEFTYSKPMEDPTAYRKVVMKERSLR